MNKARRNTSPTISSGVLIIDPKSGTVTKGLDQYAQKHGMSFKLWTLSAMIETHNKQYSPTQ